MRLTSLIFFILALFAFGCQNAGGGGGEKVSANGHKYVLHTNKGNAKPLPGEYVYFHAQMRNGDSVVYASRDLGQTPFVQIPLEETPGRQPSPVEDVVREIGEGDSVTIYINIDTMDRKPPGFENTDVIYYDVISERIATAEEYAEDARKRQEERQQAMQVMQAREAEVAGLVSNIATQYANGELEGKIQTTESGLKYVLHEKGTGMKAIPGREVEVNYFGVLADGTPFDNSFSRGQTFAFPLGAGRVIRGWDEGIALLNVGSKATLFVPYELGYGEAGSPPTIPPKAELIFYVELENVR